MKYLLRRCMAQGHGRPPRGGRGLKLLLHDSLGGRLRRSPPSRGAWIEITCKKYKAERDAVAPLAGGVD